MAPSSRLVAYQVLQNSEVAADYLPFDVTGSYPMEVDATFGSEEVRPGDAVDICSDHPGEGERSELPP